MHYWAFKKKKKKREREQEWEKKQAKRERMPGVRSVDLKSSVVRATDSGLHQWNLLGPVTQSILKEINPDYSLEGLMLKLQYFGCLMCMNWLIGKYPDAGKNWRQEEKGMTEDEMVGSYHQLNGHEFEQTLGDGEGQGNLVCCSPWGHKESDTTEWVNNNNSNNKY